MKTAMQKLAEKLRKCASISEHGDYVNGLLYAAAEAESFMMDEKEQIKDGFSDGWADGERYNSGILVKHTGGEDYYSKTYKP